jgi:hypothetical protein
MCSLAYGIDIVKQPYFLDLFEDGLRPLVSASVPGRYMIDFIPWLKYVPEWMPGASWQRDATIWRQLQVLFIDAPFKEALKRLVGHFPAHECDDNLLSILKNGGGGEHVPTSFVSLALGQDHEENGNPGHVRAVQEVASMFYAGQSTLLLQILGDIH